MTVALRRFGLLSRQKGFHSKKVNKDYWIAEFNSFCCLHLCWRIETRAEVVDIGSFGSYFECRSNSQS